MIAAREGMTAALDGVEYHLRAVPPGPVFSVPLSKVSGPAPMFPLMVSKPKSRNPD